MPAARSVSERRRIVTGTSLNLTPLLDVIFNLLFFFLLATNLRDKRLYLEVMLPTSATGEAREIEKEVPTITLAADGRLLLDGEETNEESLRARLAALVRESRVQEAVVESDAGVAVQRFFGAADICRQAGIPTVTPRVQSPRRP